VRLFLGSYPCFRLSHTTKAISLSRSHPLVCFPFCSSKCVSYIGTIADNTSDRMQPVATISNVLDLALKS
jgi:hypothetical protein